MLSRRRWHEASLGNAPHVKWFDLRAATAASDGAGWAPVCQLRLSVRGRVLVLNLFSLLLRACMVALLWVALYSVFPPELMVRGGVVFDTMSTILFSSVIGATLTVLFEMPTTPGILWGAVLWNHIGPEVGYLTSGITGTVRTGAGIYAVSVIAANAGLSYDVRTVRQKWPLVLAMTFLPFLFEMTIHSVIAKELFPYPDYSWAFLQGAVFSGIAPGVIISGMQLLTNQGLQSRPPGLFAALYPAIVLETVVAVWSIGFTSDLLFGGPDELFLASDASDASSITLIAFLGPIQVIGGAIVGFIVAAILHIAMVIVLFNKNRHLWQKGINCAHAQPMRTSLITVGILFQGTNFILTCTGQIMGFSGGGSIAVAVMSTTLANFWKIAPDNLTPSPMQRALAEQLTLMQQSQAHAWSSIAVPFLFSMTGSSIDLTKVFGESFLPRALACFVGGMLIRTIVVFLVVKFNGYSAIDSITVAVGWMAKGSVQASLGGVAVARSITTGEEDLGKIILYTSMLGTMVCAMASSAGLSFLGRNFMTKNDFP